MGMIRLGALPDLKSQLMIQAESNLPSVPTAPETSSTVAPPGSVVDVCEEARGPLYMSYYKEDGSFWYCGRKPAIDPVRKVAYVTATDSGLIPTTGFIKDYWPGMLAAPTSPYCAIVPAYYQGLCARFVANPFKAPAPPRRELYQYLGYPLYPSSILEANIKSVLTTDKGKKRLAEFFRDKMLPQMKVAYRRRLNTCVVAGLPDDAQLSVPVHHGLQTFQVTRARQCAGFLEPRTASVLEIKALIGARVEAQAGEYTDYQYFDYIKSTKGQADVINALVERFKKGMSAEPVKEARVRQHGGRECDSADIPKELVNTCKLAVTAGVSLEDFIKGLESLTSDQLDVLRLMESVPPGSITYFDKAIGQYRLAIPVGTTMPVLSGAGVTHIDAAIFPSQASTAEVVTKTTYQKATGTRPWYKKPLILGGIAAGVAVLGGGTYYVIRR